MIFLGTFLLISISTALADTTESTDTAPLGIWTKDGCMVPASAMSRGDKRLKGLIEVNDGTSRITSSPVSTGGGCESLCGCFNGVVYDPHNMNGYPNYEYAAGSKESGKTHTSEEHDSASGKQTFVGGSRPGSYSGPYGSSSLFDGSSEYSKDHSASDYDHQGQMENYEGFQHGSPSGVGQLSYLAGGKESEKTHASQAHDSQSGKHIGYQNNVPTVTYPGLGTVHSLRPPTPSFVSGGYEYSKDHSGSEYDYENNKENYATGSSSNGGVRLPLLVEGQASLNDHVSTGSGTGRPVQPQSGLKESFGGQYARPTSTFGDGYADNEMAGSQVTPVAAGELTGKPIKIKPTGGTIYVPVSDVSLNYGAGSSQSEKTHASQVQDAESGKESYLGYQTDKYPGYVARPYGSDSLVAGNSQYSKDHLASEYNNEKQKENYAALQGSGSTLYPAGVGVGQVDYIAGGKESEKTHASQTKDSESGKQGYLGYQTGKYPSGYAGPYGSDSFAAGNSEYSKDHSASEYNNEKNKENYVGLQGNSGVMYPGVGVGQVGSYAAGGKELDKTQASQVQDSESEKGSFVGYDNNNNYQTGLVPPPNYGDESYVSGTSQYSKDHSASEYENEKNKENYAGLQHGSAFGVGKLTFVGGNRESGHTHSSQLQDSESGQSDFVGYQTGKYPTGYVARPYGSDSFVSGNSEYSKDHSASEYNNEKNKENYLGLHGSSGGVYPGLTVGQAGSYVAGDKESEKTHASQVQDSESGKQSYLGYQNKQYPTGYVARPYGSDSFVSGNSEFSKDHSASMYDNEKNKQKFAGLRGSSSHPFYSGGVGVDQVDYVAGGKESEKTHASQVQDSESGKQSYLGYQNGKYPSGYTGPYESDSLVAGNSEYSKDHSASEYNNEKNKENFAGLQGSSGAVYPVDQVGSHVAGGKESEKTHASQIQDSESGKQSYLGYQNGKYPTGDTGPYGSDSLVAGNSENSKDHSASEYNNEKNKDNYVGLQGSSGAVYSGLGVGQVGSYATGGKESEKTHASQVQDSESGKQTDLGYQNKQYPNGYVGSPYGGDSLVADNSEYSKDHLASEYNNENQKENYAALQGSSAPLYSGGVGVGQVDYIAGGKQSEKTHASQTKESESGNQSYLGYQTDKYPTDFTGPYGSDSFVGGNSEYSKDHSASEYNNEKNKENYVGLQGSSGAVHPGVAVGQDGSYVAGGKESEKTHASQVQDSESGKQSYLGNQNSPSQYPSDYNSRPYGSDSVVVGNSEYSKDNSGSTYDNEKNKENYVGVQGSSGAEYPESTVGQVGSYVAGGKESEKTHASQVQDSESGKQSDLGYKDNYYPSGYTGPRENTGPNDSDSFVAGNSEYSKDHSASEFDREKNKEQFVGLQDSSSNLAPVALLAPSISTHVAGGKKSEKTHSSEVQDSESGKQSFVGYNNNKYPAGYTDAFGSNGNSELVSGSSEFSKDHLASEFDVSKSSEEYASLNADSLQLYGIPYEVLLTQVKEADCVRCAQLAELRKRQQTPLLRYRNKQ